MSRRKKQQTEVEVYEPPAAPAEPPQVPEPPESFQKLLTTAIPHKRDLRGRAFLYSPLYTPPGIKLQFRLRPGTEDFAKAKLEGWVPLPPELATTDVDEAMASGKVALLHYEVIDDMVRVGDHVVVVKLEKEWMEQYYADLREIESVLKYKALGVQVEEQTSREEEVRLPES